MPDEAHATWPSLLADKRSALAKASEAASSALEVDSERKFRAAFEKLCQEHSQTRTTQHLGNFRTQFKPIQAFIGGIDGSGRLTPPDNLASLFWAFAYAAIAEALNHGIELKEFTNELKPLSKSVPNFGADLARHFNNAKVQKPLQELYSEYIDCYTEMITHFATSPPPLSFEPIKLRFDTATAIFAARKQEWDEALLEANTVEEEARKLLVSVPIVPNSLVSQSLRPETTNVHFEPLRSLGHGTYGQVSEVREPTTGQLYARKLIHVRPDSRSQSVIEEQVKSEVAIMQKLHHPHIASVLFYVRELNAFSIVMLPVANYDLRYFLETECASQSSTSVKQLDAWFGCLVVALAYAHNCRVKHHDIKPANILIKDGSPYLSDFGSAKEFSELELSRSADDFIAGTPVYYAPERLPWGRGSDVFALGCVFSEMLTVRCGRELDAYRAFRRVSDRENGLAFRENLPRVRQWLADLEPTLSVPLKLVYQQTLRMLEADPDGRCEAKDVRRRFRGEETVDILFCNSCS